MFDAAVEHVRALQAADKRVCVGAWSEGSRERLCHVLDDHGLTQTKSVNRLGDALALPKTEIPVAVWGLEAGFETGDLAVLGEQDILGDRLVRQKRKSQRPQDFITEVAGLTPGDLVVHVDHGIGRFVGLQTHRGGGCARTIAWSCIMPAATAVPAGREHRAPVALRLGGQPRPQLDKLGGGAWQSRKSRLKQRMREMAGELIKIAAARTMKEAPRLVPPEGLYDEFAARFPYDETEDQDNAIDAVFDDLAAGRPDGPADLRRCRLRQDGGGVARRLRRQPWRASRWRSSCRRRCSRGSTSKTFADRFQGLPVNIAQASRFVAERRPQGGQGRPRRRHRRHRRRHACAARQEHRFPDLGLVIVDEEQHFGVAHKERLKALRAEVHVLTLSATPIPRTLQLALTGVRELSIIATPPVDRLAVRTFISPFDPLIVREALLRERYRGGQSFYVCPRIEDIAEIKSFLDTRRAGSQGRGGAWPDAGRSARGRDDRLLRRQVRHPAVDLHRRIRPRHSDRQHAHRAPCRHVRPGPALSVARPCRPLEDARLRAVHRSGQPHAHATAEKRLKVLQSLDTLGAGFQLASHDLDIRGAGNLLGEEQSGHIKEVGYELYQQMLEEAVAQLQAPASRTPDDEQWSPTIAIGTAVMIPETYVSDLQLRLGLYQSPRDAGERRRDRRPSGPR